MYGWKPQELTISRNGDVVYTCIDATVPQLITNAQAPFITAGASGNSGDEFDNRFNLNWRMGTSEIVTANSLGTMFDQMANGDFGPGTYTYRR